MKGKIKVNVTVTDECGIFPITGSWEYTRDNTLEGLDEWLELFEKILVTQGFHNYKLQEVDDEGE